MRKPFKKVVAAVLSGIAIGIATNVLSPPSMFENPEWWIDGVRSPATWWVIAVLVAAWGVDAHKHIRRIRRGHRAVIPEQAAIFSGGHGVFLVWDNCSKPNSDSINPEITFVFEVLNASDWPIRFNGSSGYIRLNGTKFSGSTDIEKGNIPEGSWGTLIITLRLSQQEVTHIRDHDKPGVRFDMSRFRISLKKQLFLWWLDAGDCLLPNCPTGIRR